MRMMLHSSQHFSLFCYTAPPNGGHPALFEIISYLVHQKKDWLAQLRTTLKDLVVERRRKLKALSGGDRRCR